MKRLLMMAIMVVVLAFPVYVMAADSPEYNNGTTASTTTDGETTTEDFTPDDDYSKNNGSNVDNTSPNSTSDVTKKDSTSSKSSASPKTADVGVPSTLVFVALVAGSMTIYAGKRVRE